MLIEATPALLAQAPGTRVLIVGDGPLMHDLRRRARSIGVLEAITFAGYRHDRSTLYAAMDVLAITSTYEGLGMVALEAMARGIPVVGTDVSGIRTVIESGQQGLLVPVNNSPALAAAILKLFRQPALRRRLVAGAHRRLLDEFLPKRVKAKITAVYAAVIERPSLAPGSPEETLSV
jgi:glycosyltransferase involved in cell wall biosynthesis